MALKTKLTTDEIYGLSLEEIKLATKWLRKNKTAGALKELEAAKLYELYLLGDSIAKITQQFPQYPIGQICLTASLRGWAKDRDKMLHTLQDRVRAKVVKSVLEQVDFMTTMMSVANTEHLEAMMRYCQDPMNNPKPPLRIMSIKDFKDISENLYKIVAGATVSKTNGNKVQSPMFDALTSNHKSNQKEDEEDDKEVNLSDLLSSTEKK
jgi:hypothetical protein